MRRKTIGRVQSLLEAKLWLNEFLPHKFIIPGAKKLIAKSHARLLHQVTSSQVILGYESIGINIFFRNETLSECSNLEIHEEFASNKTVVM